MLKVLACFFAMVSGLAHAGSEELRMIAPRNQSMPLAQFEGGHISGGILKDLGEALAARLGRHAVFTTVDGMRIPAALTAGEADGICYVRPIWIDGDYHWSQPLIPDAELVAARPGAPVLRSLLDLRDRPVATVAGYRYPRLEQVLGLRFQRLDSTTMEENLQLVLAGKARYTVVGKSTLAWHQKRNPQLRLRADLVFASFSAQCAFSRRSRVPPAEIDRAISSLVQDGSVTNILARYR
ncbi:transporter substrate-binding domain-containing protein [Massilia sp. PAMC28688]|uniref:substrate-binding periplasmic protein n=1 Tax=Massilia sp. PAMC28688 TaxID=2861283 RepID=UPI001C63B5F1|nr:transporter substrate-binding domain-containing protein [Massilia sp. PAMC28688]QYF91745.1 transporter substrate-binding domain-containing protein [Massilia sp. PAMC28688]